MFKQKMNQQARISPLFSAKNNIHIYSKALFFAFLSLLLICIFAINLPSATAAEDKNEAIPVTVEAVKAATFADVVKKWAKLTLLTRRYSISTRAKKSVLFTLAMVTR